MDKLLQLALTLKEVRGQVKQLQETASDIQKQEGKQGIPGEKGAPGKDGKDGVDGKDGRDGKDGKDGKDGENGEQGVSVVDAKIDLDNSLVITLSDGTEIDAGQLEVGKSDSYIMSQQTFPQLPRVWVQTTAPVNPQVGDIWYDTSN